ncbi:DUF1648 domain-containing protein [Saccharibacillus sp. JS10]|uniref:DUF1648 domain-containing protein n=1 Tax=Saccharibacillus sp. JS10 TaxID=2950552 RepID=UPI00210D6417|nr:DUF1648 domain-containing protein [Saccharibacillus sp. JS10]MCQ4085844.1 DUF1648 domain-containing protein [Saccharibacillus sp. JS10]
MNPSVLFPLLIAVIDLVWLLVLIGIPLLTPSFLFGVYVPQEDRKLPQVARIRRIFILLSVAVALIGIIFAFAFYAWSSGSANLALLGLLIPQIVGMIVVWNVCRRQALSLKSVQNWKAPDVSKRTAYIGSDRESVKAGASTWLYGLHLAIIALTVILVAINWERIPNPIPVHFDMAGLPDRYAEKTFSGVYMLTMIQLLFTAICLGTHLMIRRMRQNLNPSTPQASLNKQIQLRSINTWMLFSISLIVTVMLSWIQIRSTSSFTGTLPIGFAAAFLLLLLIPIVAFLVVLRRRGLQEEGINRYHSEDQFWRGGVFYFNPQDPYLFTEKRAGLGWTFNFARPLGWLLMAAIILLPLTAIVTTMMLQS